VPPGSTPLVIDKSATVVCSNASGRGIVTRIKYFDSGGTRRSVRTKPSHRDQIAAMRQIPACADIKLIKKRNIF
jgi:hypothetical protein